MKKQHFIYNLLEKTGKPLVLVANRLPQPFRTVMRTTGRVLQGRRFCGNNIDKGVFNVCGRDVQVVSGYVKLFWKNPDPFDQNYRLVLALDDERIYDEDLMQLFMNLCFSTGTIEMLLQARRAGFFSRELLHEIINSTKRIPDIRPYLLAIKENMLNHKDQKVRRAVDELLSEEKLEGMCSDYTKAFTELKEKEAKRREALESFLRQMINPLINQSEESGGGGEASFRPISLN